MSIPKPLMMAAAVAIGAMALLVFVRPNRAAPDTQPAVDPGSPLTLIGKPAPDFTLAGPDGVNHSPADYKGHVVVLDFWATWCVACRVEQKHLTGMYQKRQPNGLVVLAIDTNDDAAKVPQFIKDNNVSLPVLIDKADANGNFAVATAYKVDQMPQTVVIGKDGVVTAVFTQFDENTTPPLMEKSIAAAMGQ